ncbi:hypothetical protein VP1G_08314 [Cytospora mali]|uniref:Uncharacterized protein n=1 Tax=Cytospora mali TaxID=578113 RepID=A0A194VB89_CYTMA|nr:hypothetical protein VP1G_08314 [Valsa mali var. pyri (nom. inval.)]
MATRDQTHDNHLGRDNDAYPHTTLEHSSNLQHDHDPENALSQPETEEHGTPCNLDWMAYNLDPHKAIVVPVIGAALGLVIMNLVMNIHWLVNVVVFLVLLYAMRVVGILFQVYWLFLHYQMVRTGELALTDLGIQRSKSLSLASSGGVEGPYQRDSKFVFTLAVSCVLYSYKLLLTAVLVKL